MDGSHTRSRNGGESVGYQGRKSSKTSNCIFLCDNQGQMLSMGEPISGEHHDLYKIEETLEEILSLLSDADRECKGLFLNADSDFDNKKCRDILEKKEIIPNIKENLRNGDTKNEKYFDYELYTRRFKIEKANAWIDSFKALLIRIETLSLTWMNLHYLAFSILFLRKIKV
ncbi:TPA: transposase [Elizabethkingia anophelis]